jgi:hypothetical protein
MALRYKRIISEPHQLRKELHKLKTIFLARKYPKKIIHNGFKLALAIPRQTLLADKKPRNRKTRIVCKLKNSIKNKYIKARIKQLWHSSIKDPNLKKLWPHGPTFCETNHRKLKDLLVHTKQKQ